MDTFLQETAQKIIENQTDFKNTSCIVPSERAGIYLKNCLKQQLKGTISFLPRIVSIENFIKEISELESLDQVSLLFEFFNIYIKTYTGKKPDTFEKFISWATIAIQDFNEIDRHLVQPDKIFDYLTDIQKIKDWSPAKNNETDTIKNYMSFVKDLGFYYYELKKTLLEKRAGYQGIIYREAHQKKESYLEKHKHENFHFIGFNALNKAEEGIFKSFLAKENNYIYWDVDSYYYNNTHEAGNFIRKFHNTWECLDKKDTHSFVKNNFNKKKNIQILGSPLHVTSIKAATTLIGKELDSKETALVLSEETILPVVLNSIPKTINKVNITMGYSLNNIPLYGLFQALFNLHINKDKLNKNAFYYKDILSFLRHPYINQITENRSLEIIASITSNNLVFIRETELIDFFKTHHIQSPIAELFLEINAITSFLLKTNDFLKLLNTSLSGIDLLYVEGYKKVINEITNLNNKYTYINNIKVLHKIFKKILPLETIDFKGEALEGLQLMGVLETRCLDFKNVILTSVNEGILPSGKSEKSFISFEVKKHFDMPTYLAKDAIFSYHFYRLLQRAENIYLLYNTKTDDFGGGEMSRFLTQLMIDKQEDIVHRNINTPSFKSNTQPREIVKTKEVLVQLTKYFNKGASPSRITDYMKDPLDFYQKIVLKIRETNTVEEEIAHNTLGTVVHDTLELLYKPYLNKILSIKDIKAMKKGALDMVNTMFKEHFKEGNIYTGKNKLINEVANQFVLNFLNYELKEIEKGNEIIVKDLEGEYKLNLTTPKGNSFVLTGKIDRVDEINGQRRIVDYKTGKVNALDLKLSDIALATTDFKYHKIVQVMTYVLLYTQKHQFDLDKNTLQTGIYSFKNFKEGFLAMNFSANRNKELHVSKNNLEIFTESLYTLVDEILDNKLTFVENLDNPFKKEV